MLVGRLEAAGLVVSVFHAQGSEHANQDRWLSQPCGTGMRVAAIDGVTTWRPAPCPGGDPGQWGPSTVLGSLVLPMAPEEALRHANAVLHDPELAPSRRQAMAALAVADCWTADGWVAWSAVVAADGEVWTATSAQESPELALGGDFIVAESRAAWEAALAEHGARWSFDERIEAEARALEDPSTQLCHAVGRYPEPRFRSGTGNSGCLVLATDGACMQEAARQGVTVEQLGEWLASVETRTPRDDLTCVVVSAA